MASFKNLSTSRIKVETEPNKWVEFRGIFQACETLFGESYTTYKRAFCAIEAAGLRYEIIHFSRYKQEREKAKRQKRKKAIDYKREKFAPAPTQGKPGKRLNMNVSEITKPAKRSNTWKKATEHLQNVGEKKQLEAANNSSKGNDREKAAGNLPGMFPESVRVTPAKAAQKRAMLQEMVPSTNSPEYKEYKGGKSKKHVRSGAGVGAQTQMF